MATGRLGDSRPVMSSGRADNARLFGNDSLCLCRSRHEHRFRRRSRRASAHHQGASGLGGLAGRPALAKLTQAGPDARLQYNVDDIRGPAAACRYRTACAAKPRPTPTCCSMARSIQMDRRPFRRRTVHAGGHHRAAGSTISSDQRAFATRKSMSSSRSPISQFRGNPHITAIAVSSHGLYEVQIFDSYSTDTYPTAWWAASIPSFRLGECRRGR